MKQRTYSGSDRSTGPSNGPPRESILYLALTQSYGLLPKYTQCGRRREFVHDFVAAWNKVMNLDRFDVAASSPNGFVATDRSGMSLSGSASVSSPNRHHQRTDFLEKLEFSAMRVGLASLKLFRREG